MTYRPFHSMDPFQPYLHQASCRVTPSRYRRSPKSTICRHVSSATLPLLLWGIAYCAVHQSSLADGLEEWFVAGAADGFNLMPPWFPGAFEDFVDQVVPILQRRGLFRVEYAGRTLRDHLNLPRPPHSRLATPSMGQTTKPE
jgi:hypothetical protein